MGQVTPRVEAGRYALFAEGETLRHKEVRCCRRTGGPGGIPGVYAIVLRCSMHCPSKRVEASPFDLFK